MKEEDKLYFEYMRGYDKGRADALDIDMEKPMHFTDEQKAWVKNYIILNAKRQRAEAIEKIKELIKAKLIDNLMLEDATKYGNKNAKQQANSYATVMKYEIADCVDDLLDDLERLKEQK